MATKLVNGFFTRGGLSRITNGEAWCYFMGSTHTEVPSPGFAAQSKHVRFESAVASVLHTLPFGYNPGHATGTQNIRPQPEFEPMKSIQYGRRLGCSTTNQHLHIMVTSEMIRIPCVELIPIPPRSFSDLCKQGEHAYPKPVDTEEALHREPKNQTQAAQLGQVD